MLEMLIALGIFASLALTALVSHHQGWYGLLQLGIGTLALGTVLSFATGGIYHLRLSQTIACKHQRVPKWWWAPTRLHPYLTSQESLQVLPWFWAGATSFCLVVLGAVWAILAVSRMNP
jgi:hypothetical protein